MTVIVNEVKGSTTTLTGYFGRRTLRRPAKPVDINI